MSTLALFQQGFRPADACSLKAPRPRATADIEPRRCAPRSLAPGGGERGRTPKGSRPGHVRLGTQGRSDPPPGPAPTGVPAEEDAGRPFPA